MYSVTSMLSVALTAGYDSGTWGVAQSTVYHRKGVWQLMG